MNYSQLSACQGDIQPFEGDPYTCGCLTSLRNKPQQKQPRQLSASIPGWIVSQRVQLLFDGEKCVWLLCAWKPAFLRSGHIYIYAKESNNLAYPMADLIRQSIFERFMVQQKSVWSNPRSNKGDKNFQGRTIFFNVLAKMFYPRIKIFRWAKIFLTVPSLGWGR